MWERAVQQLTAMPLKSGNVLLLELRAYPGKLLLYSLGLGAVYSGRLEFLNRLFKTKVRHENNEITAAEFLARFCSITNQRMWQAFLEGMSGRHVPFSDWLYETLRQPAQHIHLSEAEYSLQFDKFEILSALAFGHQEVQKGHTYWKPVGAFVYRHENEGLVTRELTDSITSLGNESPVVQSGLVGDTPEECLASMQEFQRVVSDARRHLRIWR